MYPDLWVHLPSGCTSVCFSTQAFWRREEEEYISSSLSLVEGDLHRASHAPELSGRARGARSTSWETLEPEINKVWGAHTRHSSTSLCPWDNDGWRSYKRKQQGGEAGPGTIGQRHLSRSVGGSVWHMKPPNSHRYVINVSYMENSRIFKSQGNLETNLQPDLGAPSAASLKEPSRPGAPALPEVDHLLLRAVITGNPCTRSCPPAGH